MGKLTKKIDHSKRNALGATATLGAIGGASAAFPLVRTLAPSEKAKAVGAPVEIEIGNMKPGEMTIANWRGKPVWVLRRTKAMLASLDGLDDKLVDPQSLKSWQIDMPVYAKNKVRSIKPEYLVVVGVCPHLGCSPGQKLSPGAQPSLPSDWAGGFLCPCHGSTFDLAGRVFRNKPANENLDVPPHKFLSDTLLLIGEDEALA